MVARPYNASMPTTGAPIPRAAELALFALLMAYLVWLPMPFGSASDASQPLLVLPALLICACAALLHARSAAAGGFTRAAWIWSAGALLLPAVTALQLVPLPMAMLRILSPESAELWSRAGRLAALAAGAPRRAVPISVDPAATALQLYRTLAYGATFLSALLLVRGVVRRTILASVLCATATFEALYAARESALQRYAIWGWRNDFVFGRASGTFVNPNHFAHYAAIVLPLALFLTAYAWHTAAGDGAPLGYRIVKLIERRTIPFGFGALAAVSCVAAVVLAQSRGALLAIVGGVAIAGLLTGGRGNAAIRFALLAIAACAVIAALVLVLGRTEVVERVQHGGDAGQLASRRASALAAFRLWQRFPLFGSGAGTYEDLVLTTGATSPQVIANHAHDDYAEALATTGALGFVAALVPLFGGWAVMARATFGPRRETLRWRHFAFRAAALTSIAIAMIHALVDFNFFIPANPATLAAIAGAAASIREP